MTRFSVAVVTPVRNAQTTIERCVRSIMKQGDDVVHIVQDGASTDGTMSILRRLEAEFGKDRLRVVSEPDAGQSDGKNRALARICAPIFVVFNGDDEMNVGACQTALSLLAQHPDWDAIIASHTQVIDIDSNHVGWHQEGVEPTLASIVRFDSGAPQFNSIFFRTDKWRDSACGGLTVDARIDTCPDFDMLLRWCWAGNNIKIAQGQTFTHYRKHSGSETANHASMVQRFIDAKRRIFETNAKFWNQFDADVVVARLGAFGNTKAIAIANAKTAFERGLAKWATQ